MKRKDPGAFNNGAVLGGIFRLLGFFCIAAYGIDQFIDLIIKRKYDFVKKEYYGTDEKMAKHPANLGKHNDSMNFAFGIAHFEKDFDIFDNEYIEPVAYAFEHTQGLDGKKSDPVLRKVSGTELVKCSKDYFSQWI